MNSFIIFTIVMVVATGLYFYFLKKNEKDVSTDVVEQPVVEQPVVEQPVVEQPVVEQQNKAKKKVHAKEKNKNKRGRPSTKK